MRLAASSDLVYQAISEEDELKKWWVDVPVLEKKMGGKILFRFLKENSEMLTEDFVVGGKIIRSLSQITSYPIHGSQLMM